MTQLAQLPMRRYAVMQWQGDKAVKIGVVMATQVSQATFKANQLFRTRRVFCERM